MAMKRASGCAPRSLQNPLSPSNVPTFISSMNDKIRSCPALTPLRNAGIRPILVALLALFAQLVAGAAIPAQAAELSENANQEFLRQQERERILRQQQEQALDVRLQRGGESQSTRLPDNEAPCFRIDTIVLIGQAAEHFQWALAAVDRAGDGARDPALHRCLGTGGINLTMRRIQNAIVARGFVTTRVLAEPQDLSTGTLRLTLVPGRIRSIRFAADSDTRATQWNALPAGPGDLLNLRDIEQGLENFKRVPTAEADIQLLPAEGDDARPGESDLVIAWKQRFPLRGNLSVDDSGTKATGKYLGSATLSWDHALTLNDLLYVSLNHDLGGGDSGDRGTMGGVAHYSVPFGYWLLGLTASQSRYHQSVAGSSQTYQYSGESANGNIKLSRLIYRDAVRKTTVSLGGWARSSKNFIDDTEIEIQRRRMAGWEVGVSEREFIGPATLDLTLNYKRGTGALDSLAAPEEPFGEGTSQPKIISGDVQLTWPFTFASQRFRYQGVVRGQWNDTPLVVQDRFSIGGRFTVRGFDGENTLLAERGWLIRNDLGWMTGQSGPELYLGLDHGEVEGDSSASLLGKRLTGAVLGLRGEYQGVAYDVFVGTPLDKPASFKADGTITGFTLSWSF